MSDSALDEEEMVLVGAMIAQSELQRRIKEVERIRKNVKDEKEQNERIQALAQHVAVLYQAIWNVQDVIKPLHGKISEKGNALTIKWGSASIRLNKSGRVDIRGGNINIKGSTVSIVGTIDATITDLSP